MAGADPPHRTHPHHPPGLVRPYVRARRRTRTGTDLPVTTLVRTTDRGHRTTDFPSHTHHRICHLCRTTVSIAEIASHLTLPLGAARDLVAHLHDDELLTVHPPPDRPGLELLERTLAALRHH